MSPLTDDELTDWLVELHKNTDAAHQAAAIATGDLNTRNMLIEAAALARRREHYLRSRALVPAACTWCSQIRELCDD
ncbi:hypothetical protein [Sinomonas sp. ASV322]|uniref:hypothetical protein n=1 Tax=Sinomonas sp. ASV322 TaxID=3041920 RepID=UPI0027DB3919|nr:hypothetical protein [Sinomonas sp. ASV322]MDQ4502166.1 hypothetical protein [Sinomonas sp. ASV322]